MQVQHSLMPKARVVVTVVVVVVVGGGGGHMYPGKRGKK